MFRRRGFKHFLTVFGMLALFVAGYGATSVVTSCTAEAQVCCSGIGESMCIQPFAGIALALGIVFVSPIALDLTYIAGISIPVYYAEALISFAYKVINRLWQVIDHWYSWWDTFWNYNMSPALRDMTKQMSALNADQARAIGAFIDAMNRERANIHRRHEAVQSHRQQIPAENVCVAGTVMGGMVRGAQLSRAYNTAAPVERGRRTARAKGSPASAGTAADMANRYQNYVARYCAKAANNGFAGCTVDAPFALQDLDVTGQIFSKDTIELTDNDVRQTIDDLVTNIAEPLVTDPLPASSFGGATGQQRAMENEGYKAQRQVVYDALYHIVARRAPGTGAGIGTAAGEIAADAGITDPGQRSSNPSRAEALRRIAIDKYRNGKNSVHQVDSQENNQRELAVQAGNQMMQMSDLLDLTDRYSMIVAGETSLQVRHARGFSAEYGGQSLK